MSTPAHLTRDHEPIQRLTNLICRFVHDTTPQLIELICDTAVVNRITNLYHDPSDVDELATRITGLSL